MLVLFIFLCRLWWKPSSIVCYQRVPPPFLSVFYTNFVTGARAKGLFRPKTTSGRNRSGHGRRADGLFLGRIAIIKCSGRPTSHRFAERHARPRSGGLTAGQRGIHRSNKNGDPSLEAEKKHPAFRDVASDLHFGIFFCFSCLALLPTNCYAWMSAGRKTTEKYHDQRRHMMSKRERNWIVFPSHQRTPCQTSRPNVPIVDALFSFPP